MSKSQNWKAQSIPTIEGKKTELKVTGEVKSGIAPVKLTKRKSEGETKIFTLDLSGASDNGMFTEVEYKEDITGYEYEKVVVYAIEAEIEIKKVQSLKK